MQECEPGEQLHIGFDRSAGHAIVAISREEGRSALYRVNSLERLSTLARQIGATITVGGRLLVSIPLRSTDIPLTVDRARPVPTDVQELHEGEARHDVGSARESHHGQTGTH